MGEFSYYINFIDDVLLIFTLCVPILTCKDDVVTMSRKGDKIILVKLILGGNIINIISVYAPQVGLYEHIKTWFWDSMDELMWGIPQGEHVFIGRDFNDHVGKNRGGYEMVHGGHGFGDRNYSREAIIDFVVAYDLIVTNNFFRKRDEHLITFKSGPNMSQIVFFLNENDR